MKETTLKRAADNVRILAAAMVEKAQSGHPGGAMGGADFLVVLLSEYLRYDPDDRSWWLRDRFFLDPGHMSPMLYAGLALTGSYSMDELRAFRQWGSVTPGHPEVDTERGVENTSGPLGQGHTFAVGAAIVERFLAERFGEWTEHKTVAFISDGGVQEEISQGAGRLAGYLGLNNLIMFYDANDIQLSVKTSAVTSEDTASKYRAWGWKVLEIKGNHIPSIRQALEEAFAETDKPVLIIGKTIMGLGAVTQSGLSYEGKVETHGQPLSAAGADVDRTIENLGGDPSNPFVVFPDVAAHFQQANQEKRAQARKRKIEQTEWEQANPKQASKWKRWFSSKPLEWDTSQVKLSEGAATRVASGNVLAALAEQDTNLIVMSADLANSDKTDAFLKKTTPFTYQNFSGSFLHIGVSELTMGAVANGMALHGGVRPVCATFFVFSDYMKPAIRMAALMELDVIYLWTHDSFRVGEDGPTHQPIEQESQIRLLESLKNHSGEDSLRVFRPADSQETLWAWQMALQNRKTPTALILSRQTIPTLPCMPSVLQEGTTRGGYIVLSQEEPDVVLVANGSEVSTLVEGATELEKKGVKAQVVSVLSEGLFWQQEKAYREKLFPVGVPRFGLTAGLPITLERLVGENGMVWGMKSFGFSAPYKVLAEKLGYTTENVCQKVLELLK